MTKKFRTTDYEKTLNLQITLRMYNKCLSGGTSPKLGSEWQKYPGINDALLGASPPFFAHQERFCVVCEGKFTACLT